MHYYILITGLMSSGKSTLINEYIRFFPNDEFTKPPLEVKFRGMDFEFIDSTFAIRKGQDFYNFYELDAPTIQKWVQFVHIADAIIIVYNHQPKKLYGTHTKLLETVVNFKKKESPLIFIANNCNDPDEAKSKVMEIYNLGELKDQMIDIISIPAGKTFFDKKYGMRVEFDKNILSSIYSKTVQHIINYIDR